MRLLVVILACVALALVIVYVPESDSKGMGGFGDFGFFGRVREPGATPPTVLTFGVDFLVFGAANYIYF